MDYRRLNEIDVKKKYSESLKYGIKAQISLSHKQSIKIFKKAIKSSKKLSNDEKLKALKGLGFSYLYIGHWKSAYKVFNHILSFIDDDLESIGVLALLEYKLNNLDRSLKCTLSFLKRISEDIDDLQIFLDDWILRMLNLLGELNFTKIIQNLYDAEISKKDVLIVELGNKIGNLGYINLGIELMNKALILCEEDKIKALCLNNLGILYYNQEQPEKAIKYYKKCIALDKDICYYYQNIAAAYSLKLDYLSALKNIEIVLKICRENADSELTLVFTINKQKLKDLSKDVVNINKVSDKVKAALISAERIFKDYHERDILPDASSIVHQYSKSLEIMLDERISTHIKAFLKKEYKGGFINNKDIRIKFGNLLNNKTISLGRWERIIEDIKKPDKHHLKPFKKIIEDNFDEEALNAIRMCCNTIIEDRNPGAHSEIIEMSQIIALRSKIVSQLNQVINYLY